MQVYLLSQTGGIARLISWKRDRGCPQLKKSCRTSPRSGGGNGHQPPSQPLPKTILSEIFGRICENWGRLWHDWKVPFSPVHEDTTMRKCNGQKGKDSDNVDNKSPQAKFSVACLLYLDQKVSSLSSKLGRTWNSWPVRSRGGRCSLFLTMQCFSRCNVFQFLTMSFLGDV